MTSLVRPQKGCNLSGSGLSFGKTVTPTLDVRLFRPLVSNKAAKLTSETSDEAGKFLSFDDVIGLIGDYVCEL